MLYTYDASDNGQGTITSKIMVSRIDLMYVCKITDKQKNLDKLISTKRRLIDVLLWLLHDAPFVMKSLSVLTNAATSDLGSAASQSSLLRSAGTALRMLFKRFSLV